MTPCPCGPASTVGGLPTCHPAGGCDGTGYGGLLCEACAGKVWAILEEPLPKDIRKLGTKAQTRERREADMSPEAVAARRLLKARKAEALAFVASYRGTFGLILDIRADRRFGSKHMTLTEKQVDAILSARDRDLARDANLESARINTEQANADEYLEWMEAQSARPTTPAAPRLAPQPSSGTAPGGPVTEGMYRMPDGTITKVQRAVHGSGQLYAKRLVVGDTGSFEYEAGLIRRLRAENRMTVDEAAEFGRLYGWCCVCGRTLTDEKSIAAGIGPVCANKV